MADHRLLTAEDHRDLRVRSDTGAALGDAVMSCIVVPDEFRRVQNEYVILFRASPERDGFTALALFGFENGENLYLEGDRWDAQYRPMAMAIQPFLIGAAGPASEARQVHVDMSSPRISSGEGVRVFDADGRPTPYLETIADQLGALDAGWQATGDFFAALRRHALIEPLTLEITLDDGTTNRLVGFHGIDEARLEALDGDAVGTLHAEGHLLPIFMVVASLANLRRLIARKNRRTGHG